MDVLVPMTAYMCLSVASEVTYGSWIYTLATERAGLSDASAASLTSAFWAAFTATRFALSFVGAAWRRDARRRDVRLFVVDRGDVHVEIPSARRKTAVARWIFVARATRDERVVVAAR